MPPKKFCWEELSFPEEASNHCLFIIEIVKRQKGLLLWYGLSLIFLE